MHPPIAGPQVLDLFEQLREQHRTVAARTAALHGTCERLVAERGRLEELAGAIRAKLAYFDELESVAAQVGPGCAIMCVCTLRWLVLVGVCACCCTMAIDSASACSAAV